MEAKILPIDRNAERDRLRSRVFDRYRRARIALEYKKALGRTIDLNPRDEPDLLPATIDESAVAILKQEMIDTFNKDKPAEGWAYPDGTVIGNWQRLPDDPSKLAAWVDDDVTAKVAEIAANCRGVAK